MLGAMGAALKESTPKKKELWAQAQRLGNWNSQTAKGTVYNSPTSFNAPSGTRRGT